MKPLIAVIAYLSGILASFLAFLMALGLSSNYIREIPIKTEHGFVMIAFYIIGKYMWEAGALFDKD